MLIDLLFYLVVLPFGLAFAYLAWDTWRNLD